MAKIKCSICSYQFNIWYAGHSPAQILIWFLAFGQGSEVYLTLTTGCLGIALQLSAAHKLFYLKEMEKLLRYSGSFTLRFTMYLLSIIPLTTRFSSASIWQKFIVTRSWTHGIKETKAWCCFEDRTLSLFHVTFVLQSYNSIGPFKKYVRSRNYITL